MLNLTTTLAVDCVGTLVLGVINVIEIERNGKLRTWSGWGFILAYIVMWSMIFYNAAVVLGMINA